LKIKDLSRIADPDMAVGRTQGHSEPSIMPENGAREQRVACLKQDKANIDTYISVKHETYWQRIKIIKRLTRYY
jgi:hypothetical protein